MSKVVLFGGNGYIGSAFIEHLFKLNKAVKLVIASRSAKQKLPVSSGVAIEHKKADITNEEQVRNACDGADVVVNLVGLMDETPPNNTFDLVQNYGALNVAKAVKANINGGRSCRLVHLSAIGADLNSSVPYARTKAEAEIGIQDLFRDLRKPTAVIVRPGLVVGPNDQFLNRFHMLTKFAPVFPLFGGGLTKFQPIYIDDLCRIIENSCFTELKGSSPVIHVEVGGSEVFTFAQLIEMTTRKGRIETPWLRAITPPVLFPLPMRIAILQAWFMERLFPPGHLLRLSTDQIKLLQIDNIVRGSTMDHVKNIAVLRGESSTSLLNDCKFPRLGSVYNNGQWCN